VVRKYGRSTAISPAEISRSSSTVATTVLVDCRAASRQSGSEAARSAKSRTLASEAASITRAIVESIAWACSGSMPGSGSLTQLVIAARQTRSRPSWSRLSSGSTKPCLASSRRW
jgi:hypothetical protein